MTRKNFNANMAMLAATWPERPVSPETHAAYWLVLSGMTDEVFAEAAKRCALECTFFPKPAEIMQRATAVLTEAGQLPPEAEAAWELVMASMREYSVDNGWLGIHPNYPELGRVYGRPCPLPQPIQGALAALGGMSRICMTPEHELGFVRKEFMEHYEGHRQLEIAHGGVLLGTGRKALTA